MKTSPGGYESSRIRSDSIWVHGDLGSRLVWSIFFFNFCCFFLCLGFYNSSATAGGGDCHQDFGFDRSFLTVYAIHVFM